MRRVLPLFVLFLSASSAYGYQYWNDIRHSALLPDDTMVVRVENPAGAGEENYILYEGSGIEETAMMPVVDGPSTVVATVPGPVSATRYYGFRLTQGEELDLMPVRLADGVPPGPGDLTRVAEDAAGDELFGYSHLDLVDCHISFSGTELHTSLENVGGGFPVSQGLTFFGYLLGIADPAQVDPDTVFALMYTYELAGVISPGLYKVTGTGLDDLERLGDVAIQEYPAINTLVLSCQLGDLMSDPYFLSWYDPLDPTIGVAGFTQRIQLIGGAAEADRTPGGRCYLREFTIDPGVNQPPGLSNVIFQGEGAQATAQIDYLDADGHCPVLSEIVFDDIDTYQLYPQSLDYGGTVIYRSDAGIEPLATGIWSTAVFRFSDNHSDVIEVEVPGISVGDQGLPRVPWGIAAMVSPNPITRSSTIDLLMPEAGKARVAIFDVRGMLVRTLVDGGLPAGSSGLCWDGRSDDGSEVTAGVYFLRLTALGQVEVKKLVMVR